MKPPPSFVITDALSREYFPANATFRILISSRVPGSYRTRELTTANGIHVIVEYRWY
jgi:hypothetical protein